MQPRLKVVDKRPEPVSCLDTLTDASFSLNGLSCGPSFSLQYFSASATAVPPSTCSTGWSCEMHHYGAAGEKRSFDK
jgi:hypothetical protein